MCSNKCTDIYRVLGESERDGRPQSVLTSVQTYIESSVQVYYVFSTTYIPDYLSLVDYLCKYDKLVLFVSANRVKVFYGLLKEPDINMPIDDEDETAEGDDKPKVINPCHSTYHSETNNSELPS
jgi:hypothetical protein